MRNSFLEVLRVRRFADIQLHSGLEVGGSWVKLRGWNEKKVEYHLRKCGRLDSESEEMRVLRGGDEK